MTTFTKVIFNFIIKNPPMALIAGGILLLIMGAMMIPINSAGGWVLINYAPWLIGLGVILQIIYMVLKAWRGHYW